MTDVYREHVMADAKEAEETDRHLFDGELQCECCGEWVPEGQIKLVEVNDLGGCINICDGCRDESKEFHACEMCGDIKHEDLMHDDIICEACFRDIQITSEERVS